MKNTMTVGWIGLGKMGSPMSRHIASAGHTLHVYDPAAEARSSAVAAGAHLEADAQAVAAAAPIVFSSIPNDAVLTSLVLGPNGLAETHETRCDHGRDQHGLTARLR